MVTPVIALLNFFVFFWGALADEIDYRRGRVRHQTSHQTIQFKSAVRQQRKKEAERGYRHKCDVCGRTDTDHPELEFRYCSRCARLPLLLPGPHLQPRPLHRMITQEGLR